MNTKEQIFKYNNTIVELSKLLSDKLWDDESIKDRFVLAAFADGINSAATEMLDLVECYSDPDDNNPKSLDQDSGENG
jgi:hypothetical protein